MTEFNLSEKIMWKKGEFGKPTVFTEDIKTFIKKLKEGYKYYHELNISESLFKRFMSEIDKLAGSELSK